MERLIGDRVLILYDGVCGLCNRLNRFVIARDRRDRFRFAALQSDLARAVLQRHGEEPSALDTFYLVLGPGTPGERLLERSTAAARLFQELGGGWRVLALLRYLPRSLRDLGYRLIARNRYRLFGMYDSCPIPPRAVRDRFIDGS